MKIFDLLECAFSVIQPTALVSVLLRTETNLSAFDLINTQACFDLGFSHLHTCLAIRARILRFLRKFKFQIFGKLQLTKFEWSFVKLATKSAVAFMFFFSYSYRFITYRVLTVIGRLSSSQRLLYPAF